MVDTFHSEHVSKRELDLPAAVARAGDLAEVRGSPGRGGVLKCRRVGQVEELRAELDPLALCDIEILEDREIHLGPSGAVQIGLPDLAEGAGGRSLERRRIKIQLLDVVVPEDRIDPCDRVGPDRAAAAAVADLRSDREGIAALGEEYSGRLPPAEDELRRSGQLLAPG